MREPGSGNIPSFETAAGLRNPHLQTVVSRIVRSRKEPRYSRTRLDTPDGDFVDLDVWPGPDEPVGVCLLLHGLEGSARSGYMMSTSEALAAGGIQAVALNFRSCSGEPIRLPRAYHSWQTDDIERALTWLSERYPGVPRTSVGFSLGGNALLNLLGRDQGDSGLVAAVVVSVPYDLSASATVLDRGPIRLYGRRFLRSLRSKAREKAARFPEIVVPEAASARTLREFDDLLTAPLHGFRDAADYYERCSSGQFVGSVTIPVLLIHSRDDPLAPVASMPLETIRRRPNLSLHLTERGGHVGFLDRRLGTGPGGWLEQSIGRYLTGKLSPGDNVRSSRAVLYGL
ncbi:YheT family hydrolase [Candidatus Palauibacter sp.]|uniref:YheT family hydrolase n=1 Tax=Candidatus Palauibacter sp. TaxID=3101350 RepID=UPI003B5C5FFE